MREALLYLVPALLLLASLLLGRYPGERLRLSLGRPRRLARLARPVPPGRPSSLAPLPRGGALLGMALAGRAPPAVVSAPHRRGQARPQTEERKTKMRRIAISIAAAGALLLTPAAAQAHVTLQPSEAAAGSFTVLDVRVPNETEDANTTKVQVQFPPGFAEASYQPLPGWSVKVIKEKLAKPVQTDDGPVTEAVHEMIWTGQGSEGRIAPGQFMDFPVSVQIPGKTGEELTFKALQTYDNGEIVRWIGAPESEHPAPQVLVTAEAEDHHGGSDPAAASSSDSGDGDKASKGLGIAAMAVGALGLIVGGAALLRSRRGSKAD